MDSFRGDSFVVNGLADNGEYWTLTDCQFHFGNAASQEFRVGYAFDGVGMDPKELDSLTELAVEFDAMWTAVTASPTPPSTRSRPATLQLEADIAEGVSVSLTSELVPLLHEQTDGVFRYQDRLVFIGRSATPMSYVDLFRTFFDPLQKLLTLALQAEATVRSCMLRGPGTDVRTGGRAAEPTWVAAVRDQISRQEAPATRVPVLRIPTDAERFQAIIGGWFKSHPWLETPITLRLLNLVDRISYSEPKFLLTAQALEALHRRLWPDLSIAASEDARTAALAAVPVEHKDWLRRRLEHAHEPTFRRRVRDLMKTAEPELSSITSRERNELEGRLVNARNAVTHWDPTMGDLDGLELVALRMAADAIFDLALLKHIGATDSELETTVSAHRANNVHYWLGRAIDR